MSSIASQIQKDKYIFFHIRFSRIKNPMKVKECILGIGKGVKEGRINKEVNVMNMIKAHYMNAWKCHHETFDTRNTC